MERLFNDLIKHLAEKLGSKVNLIDEDYGQLDDLQNGNDRYPVTFPALLISMPDTTWQDIKPNRQMGRATLTVTLAMDCYDDTHYGSGQEEKAAERMRLAEEVNGYIHGWSFEGCAGPMRRSRTQCYSLMGGIKVYAHTYTTSVEEQTSVEKG